jgi:hypothetical protein
MKKVPLAHSISKTFLGFSGVGLGLWLLCSGFTGCVPVDQLPPGLVPTNVSLSTAPAANFGALEAGNTSVTSVHFIIEGYNESDLRTISSSAESIYNKIGNDTGLYSFLAGLTFSIVVYKDREEYLQKTHQPTWSHSVDVSTAIYTYVGAATDPVMAHEITHLIFNGYMGDRAATFRWLNEGLAMYEEVSKMSTGDASAFQTSLNQNLKQTKMPFSSMTFFTPSTEEKRETDAWFQQVESVVSFIIAQGNSPLAFGATIGELKNGADFDRAISDNYGSKWRNLADLENQWKGLY